MSIGISYWFGYPSFPEERVKLIKCAGFSSVSLHWTNEYEDVTGERKEVFSALNKNDIEVSSFHLSFEKSHLLWSESMGGALYRKEIMNAINDAYDLGVKRIIIHTDGNVENCSWISIMSEILYYARTKGIILCIENLQHEDNLERICSNENYRNIAVCYDIGHNNIRKCPISIKNLNIQYFHIHDNNGITDSHFLPYKGTVDWECEMELLRQFPNTPKILEVHSKIQTEKDAMRYLNIAKEIADMMSLIIHGDKGE